MEFGGKHSSAKKTKFNGELDKYVQSLIATQHVRRVYESSHTIPQPNPHKQSNFTETKSFLKKKPQNLLKVWGKWKANRASEEARDLGVAGADDVGASELGG